MATLHTPCDTIRRRAADLEAADGEDRGLLTGAPKFDVWVRCCTCRGVGLGAGVRWSG